MPSWACLFSQSRSRFSRNRLWRNRRRSTASPHAIIVSLGSGDLADAATAGLAGRSAFASVSGIVKDLSGAAIPGAVVTLATADPSDIRNTQSDSQGAFTFAGVESGPYKLSVASPGYNPWTASTSLGKGESRTVSDIALSLPSVNASVEVLASRSEVSAAQVSLEEKQRVLGVFPNFYASYLPDADPLTPKQKFMLAWRFAVDPVAFAMAGAIAGAEQWDNGFSGYGRGAAGYGKRFGATYADGFTSTLLGQAVFPSLFHQDPRYFVKGHGSIPSRALYAIASTVVCKGDNHHWQVNYSNILGNAASAGISNVYYPANNRHGAAMTVQNSLVTTALGALGGIFQEFFLRRMTPNIPNYDQARHP